MVRLRCLLRGHLPASAAFSEPSPAAVNSNRVAVQAFDDKSCCVYISSGTSTYQMELSFESEDAVRGKDCLTIPSDLQISEVNKVSLSLHRSEIQSVSISEPSYDLSAFLGTADSYGRIVVSHMVRNGKDVFSGSTFTACPEDAGVGDGGWAGLAFSPGQPSLISVARSFAKSIDFYDRDMHIRTMRTLRHPTAITFLDKQASVDGSSSVLAITEGCEISVWDVRAAENGGCVQRVLGSSVMEPLFAVCTSSDGLMVATGGADRTAVVFDRRKWMALSRWTGCLKYEITGMSFSDVDPSVLYLHGLDYEVVCGRWASNMAVEDRQHFAFRGDSRWLGLSKSANSDVIAGWCESGSIFVGEAVSEPSQNGCFNANTLLGKASGGGETIHKET